MLILLLLPLLLLLLLSLLLLVLLLLPTPPPLQLLLLLLLLQLLLENCFYPLLHFFNSSYSRLFYCWISVSLSSSSSNSYVLHFSLSFFTICPPSSSSFSPSPLLYLPPLSSSSSSSSCLLSLFSGSGHLHFTVLFAHLCQFVTHSCEKRRFMATRCLCFYMNESDIKQNALEELLCSSDVKHMALHPDRGWLAKNPTPIW